MSIKRLATEALDLQLSMIRYYKGNEGKLSIAYFIESMVQKEQLYFPDGMDGDQYAAESGLRIAQELTENLGVAPTFYMTDDMMTLNLLAGEKIPSLIFQQEDLPTPNGFLLLPRPLITIDIHGKRLSSRCLAWWRSEVNSSIEGGQTFKIPVLMLALFSNKNDVEADDYMQDLYDHDRKTWLSLPVWALCHWCPIYFDASNGITDAGRRFDIRVEPSPDEEQVESFYAFLRSFFLLVRQKIAVIDQQHPDRAGQRRWASAGLLPEYGEIQIVTLRKERPATDAEIGDGTPVNWTHRWVTSGHWRNQFYPSLQRHEPIWIESFVKGPAHLPLIVKDKVFVWKR